MKKLLLLALIGYGAYTSYQKGQLKGIFGVPRHASHASSGSHAKDRNAEVVLFVGPGCGEHCDRIRDLLSERKVAYEEIDVAGPDGAPVGNSYGVNRYPTTLIGSRQILGDDMPALFSTLAETFGNSVLTDAENIAMAGHFDGEGRPKIVMYGTSWCPICKQEKEFFESNRISFDNVDVEESVSGARSYGTLKGTGYPLTYVGYRRIAGFNEQKLREAIRDLVE